MELRQGVDSVADYTITFRTLAAQSGWNEAALWAVFHGGLNPALQTELACREEATSLTQFVAMAIRLDNLLRQHQAGAHPPVLAHPRVRSDVFRPREEAPEPMQLGRSRLTEQEHRRHGHMRLCYYCGASGHMIHWFPERPSSAQVALIDSGAAMNLIDGALVEELRIPTIPCVPSLRITAIDSQTIGGACSRVRPNCWSSRTSLVEDSAPLSSGRIPRVYEDFQEVFSEERAARLPSHQAWDCVIDLLPNASPPRGRVYPLSLPETKAMEEYIEEALAPLVPAALEQLRGVRFFTKLDLRSAYNLVCIREGDKWKTTFHTTHGHYEYLVMPFGLTNAPAVFQSLINGVFQDILGKWVTAYIDDILVYSTSLEEHMRHVREVLSRLQWYHIFIKPEKCVFHQSTMLFLGYVITQQGVEMDVTKVQAVTEWPSPSTVKELQRFPGFANFYRRFIRNYSSVAGPLTSLLKGKPRRLAWMDQAQAAFQQLKGCFTSAPILRHPDPDLPFVVEVDASSSGLGAMLSQQHGEPGKLHLCAFYSRKLTAMEANYEVGNWELLSIKAALEEWRHWLEGARHPFTVLTDHRNLEYLRGAKRLNPRQARQFEAASEPMQPDLILSVTAILAPVGWSLMEEIRRAYTDEPPPTGCPATKVFVPLQFCHQVMQWVHEAPSSGHPGIRWSTQLARRRFWWPSLGTDVEDYVQACPTCAQSRGSRQLPEGLLEPLLIP
ncbi:hypothetical protein QTP70_014380 [Hemibagrus guttatus]|uniref:Gypsy retrotransposon integrase-like protein 1 n=1 Tax=Hemibagrus guttatus TaxID=175788 RepID=A0AAE0UIG6_9TELE|nr:hypothetical protein QTP70_014380 [Hemibagrus guttatus]